MTTKYRATTIKKKQFPKQQLQHRPCRVFFLPQSAWQSKSTTTAATTTATTTTTKEQQQ
jgi:hypothetical protein